MDPTDSAVPPVPQSRPALMGDQGQLILRSPCERYEIRRAILPNFPAECIVNATNRCLSLNTVATIGSQTQLINMAGPGLTLWAYNNTEDYPSGLEIGEAVASPSFNLLSCRNIIHVNGPSYRTIRRQPLAWLKQKLADCYRRCLEEALRVGARSVAFPCISTGSMLGWPREEAAQIGMGTVRSWFNHPIFGNSRREKLPGPLYFLSDPIGSYEHQEVAWWSAFCEIWPELPRPPPRQNRRERIRLPIIRREIGSPCQGRSRAQRYARGGLFVSTEVDLGESSKAVVRSPPSKTRRYHPGHKRKRRSSSDSDRWEGREHDPQSREQSEED